MPAPQCLQSLDNGQPCNAPQVNGSKFCRHHDPQRELEQERQMKLRQKQPFSLPDFNDNVGIVVTIKAVLNAMADRRIKRSEAETFLHGLKFAGRLIAEINQAGGTSFADPHSGHDVWVPTLFDIDEFCDTIQNGTPEQLIGQIVAKQKARTRNTAEPAQPRLIERAQSQPVTRRPSNQALARLAASGNQKAAEFLASIGYLWQEQNHASPLTASI